MASAVNNYVARTAALIAVALLPAAGGITGLAYRHPAIFSAGLHRSLISATLCVAAGALAAVAIHNPAGAMHPKTAPRSLAHRALDAPPQRITA
jgi:hypothetical protein